MRQASREHLEANTRKPFEHSNVSTHRIKQLNIFSVFHILRARNFTMAKTRAQSSKLFAKKIVAGLNINKVKKSSGAAKQQFKKKNTLIAVKLQSKSGKEKKSFPSIQDLMKLCRPISIRLTRIKESSGVDSKSYYDFACIFFILLNFPFKINKKTVSVHHRCMCAGHADRVDCETIRYKLEIHSTKIKSKQKNCRC